MATRHQKAGLLNDFLHESLAIKASLHRALQGAPPTGRQLYFTFPSAPDLFFKASKAPFLTLRVATPSGAPCQAPLDLCDRLRSLIASDLRSRSMVHEGVDEFSKLCAQHKHLETALVYTESATFLHDRQAVSEKSQDYPKNFFIDLRMGLFLSCDLGLQAQETPDRGMTFSMPQT